MEANMIEVKITEVRHLEKPIETEESGYVIVAFFDFVLKVVVNNIVYENAQENFKLAHKTGDTKLVVFPQTRAIKGRENGKFFYRPSSGAAINKDGKWTQGGLNFMHLVKEAIMAEMNQYTQQQAQPAVNNKTSNNPFAE
jgi:hypothetical protein